MYHKTTCLLVATSIAVLLLLGSSAHAGSASAEAGSSGWWIKPVDRDDGYWMSSSRDAAIAATIEWTAGVNTADGATAGPTTFTEPKFVGAQLTAEPPNPPLSHNLTGLTLSLIGPKGSSAVSTGFGVSTATPYAYYGSRNPIYHTRFTTIATGSLGTLPADYHSLMTASDPWPIEGPDLTEIEDPTFDLLIPLEMTWGEIAKDRPEASAEVSYSVGYETADGMLDIFNISIDGTNVDLSLDAAVEVYLMSTLLDAPDTSAANLLTESDLITMFSSYGAGWDEALTLGFYLRDITVPDTPMGDGSLAQIHVGVGAEVADAAIPEPATLSLLGIGALSLMRRRK